MNYSVYSQWTDITSTIGGGLTSTTNMAKPYVFDLNNDNYPDFLVPVLTTVASPYTKYWRLYKNNGNSTFTDATNSYGLPTNLTSTLGFIDYNSDGFKDLYFITATGLQIFKNNNGTSFTNVSTQLGIPSALFISGETTSPFKVFDYDLDGDEDLLYTRTVSGANTLTAIVNNGTSFSTKVNILTAIPGGAAGINFSFFDMDNDGDFDIVFDGFTTTSQYSNGITTLYKKDATGYINTTSSSGLVNGLPGEISTIDINQDGNLDIVKGGADCCSSPLYRVFIGNGTGVFTEQTSTYSISNGAYKYSGTLTDFDNDTDFDFSWSSYTSTGAAPFRLYVNNGSNVFAENATTYGLNLGVTSGGVPIDDNGNGVWMDLDKDGDLDIILNRDGSGSTSTTGNVWIKRNPLQGNYINIKLNGCGVNKSGIGAKIKLVVGTNTKWLYYEKSPDGNTSNGTDTFHFGLGSATLINSITVYWPNNTTTVLNNVTGNQFLTIGGGAGSSSAPTGSASQTLCSGSTVTNLTATGTTIKWYSSATGGTALASTTALVNGTTYYASQTVNGCESTSRLAVTVTISAVTTPTGSAIQYFCGSSTIASFVVNGLNIKWYATSTGGTELPLTTLITNGTIFYASSTNNNCESPTRFAVQGYIKNTSLIASSNTICSGASVTLTASDTSSTSTTYLWSTGATTSSIVVSPQLSTTYWVDIISNGSSCRKYITIVVNNSSVSATNSNLCQPGNVTLTANVQNNSSANNCSSINLPSNLQTNLLAWYPFCGNVNDQTANNNNGTVTGSTSYVTDRNNNSSSAFFFNGSTKIQIPHNNSLNAFPFSVSAWVKSSNIKPGHIIGKYENATWNGWTLGGEPKGSGSYLRNRNNAMISGYDNYPEFSTQPINDNTWHNLVFVVDQYSGRIYLDGALQDTQLWRGTPGVANSTWPMIIGYYAHTFVSIGTETGYFNGATDDIGVWGRALTDVEVQQLYASQSAPSYLWSTGATTASINVTPTTTTQYWVDITTNGITCRKNITITVNSNTPPTGSTTQTLCSGSTVANLTATGTDIKWYATSTGGTALAATTALVTGTTYYATQTINGCESTTRLAVTVSLNNPTVSATATTICGGSSVSLTASDGNNSQQIDNKTAQFSNNVSNMIGISYNPQSIPTNNFSYEFWFNTTRTITLLTEKTGGVSVQAVNGQNFVVIPDFYNTPYYRGTGVSVGTNGISVIEHSGNFFDARLTYASTLTGWHHCTVVYQNNAFSLYLDGNLIGSRSNGTNFGGFGTQYNTVGLLQTIGKGYPGFDANDNYTGKLDEYRQWSVALTASQISQIYRRKLQSINMAECNLNLTFDQNTADNNSITTSGLSLSNTSLPNFTSDNTFQIGGFIGTTINSITNTNFTGTSSSSYSWSTGQTSQTITVIPAQTTQYWVDVTTNGVTCRKFITIIVNTNIAPSINVTTQSSCTTPSGSVQITSPISGGITPQNIFISEVADANSGSLSYIELFNKTGNNINLSNYKIKIYNNGISTPSCATILSGTIANNSTYIIKLSPDVNQNGIIPNFTLSGCSIDTNDNIRLTTANDVEVDIWGRTDGIVFTPNNQPGYTYRRNSNAILPSTTWSPVDWDEIDPEDYTNIGTYVFPTNNVYNYSVDGGAFQTSTIFSGLAVGNHTITVKDMTTGCTSSTTFTIQSASIVPTGNIEQTFCSGAAISNLVANGTTINWYLTPSGGTALSSSTLLLNNTSYFATQTINGCESQTRLEVKVTLVNIQINTPNTTVCPAGSTTLTASDLNNLSSTNCLNVSAQLQNGLQAFYPFCGNANDISGSSLNGTVVGATSTSDRFGNLNSAYLFGQNQQINIPNTSGKNTYPLTISLWYNTSTVSDGQGQNGRSIFTKYTPASWNGFGIGLFDYSNEGQGLATAPLYLRNTSNRVIGLYNESAFNQSNVQFNTWYHVVFTLDANGGKMYLNGQLISTKNWTGTAGPSNSGNLWKIGGKWDYWFNGKIDDVAVWNRVLSPIEVQEIYSTPMTTTSSTYLWSTGETTPSISVSPTQTTQYSVAVTTNGVTCVKNITITVGSATPAPTGANNQTMTQGSTLANLVVTGQNIQWYSTPFGGTPLPANTPLVSGVTYYASQTINGCESQFRLPVIVQVTLSNNEFDTIKIVYNPNPVIDILYIKASIELKNAKICNLLGQTIFQQRFNSNEIQLNMSDFPTGTYFVIVESDDRKETFKILKK